MDIGQKSDSFSYFTIEQLRTRVDSVFNASLIEFCEWFLRAWQPFHFKDDAEVRFSFSKDSLRHVYVHIRIGAVRWTRALEWTISQPGDSMRFAVEQAQRLIEEIYNSLHGIAVGVLRNHPASSWPALYYQVPISESLFDKVLAGQLSALPIEGFDDKVHPGTILRLLRNPDAPTFHGEAAPIEDTQSVDVTVTSAVQWNEILTSLPHWIGPRIALVCFAPLPAKVSV